MEIQNVLDKGEVLPPPPHANHPMPDDPFPPLSVLWVISDRETKPKWKKSCCDNEGIMKTGYINNENSRNKMNIDTEKNIDKSMHELIMVKQN